MGEGEIINPLPWTSKKVHKYIACQLKCNLPNVGYRWDEINLGGPGQILDLLSGTHATICFTKGAKNFARSKIYLCHLYEPFCFIIDFNNF